MNIYRHIKFTHSSIIFYFRRNICVEQQMHKVFADWFSRGKGETKISKLLLMEENTPK